MPYLGLYAAGSNSHGQLGVGHEDDAHTFTKCNIALDVNDISTLSIKLCAGANHTLLLVHYDGLRELFIAGSSRRGQLGKWDEEENKLSFEKLSIERLLDDLQIPSDDLIGKKWILKDIAAAWETSFFLLQNSEIPSETILLASGSIEFGQLGITSSTVQSNVIRFKGAGDITSIYSGPRHTAVIDENGTIFAWGASRHGQLGSEVKEAIAYTPVTLSTHGGVGQIALGHQHTAIVTNNANEPVLLLGNNKKGQLGTADPKARQSTAFQHEYDKSAPEKRLEVFANWNASFVLDRNANNLYSFGNNASGQLGRESHSFGDIDAVQFKRRTPEDGADMKIVQIATGSEHTLAIVESTGTGRQVMGWGWNEHGNLGLGEDVLEDVRRPVRIDLPTAGQIHSVHAGNGTSWIAMVQDTL